MNPARDAADAKLKKNPPTRQETLRHACETPRQTHEPTIRRSGRNTGFNHHQSPDRASPGPARQNDDTTQYQEAQTR